MLPPTTTVCGRRLLPFCLRHRVALESIGSPILDTSKTVTVADIILAARILSTYDLNNLPAKPTFREQWWAARLKYNKKLLLEQLVAFVHYFAEQSFWPRFWEKDKTAKSNGIPWQLAIVAGLMRNGCSYEDAWTMPESQAVWLHMANVTASGADVQIVSDTEWAAMEKCKAEAAAKASRN